MNNPPGKDFLNNELTAYVGLVAQGLMKSGYSPSDSKHIVTASMVSYIMENLVPNEDGSFDYHVLKPLLVAMKFVFDKELELKQADAYIPQVQADMAKLKLISEYLGKRIGLIKNKNRASTIEG